MRALDDFERVAALLRSVLCYLGRPDLYLQATPAEVYYGCKSVERLYHGLSRTGNRGHCLLQRNML